MISTVNVLNKICTYCKETKDISSFAISSSFDMPIRISSRCKICLNAIAKSKRIPKARKIGYKTKILELLSRLNENEIKELYEIIKDKKWVCQIKLLEKRLSD